MLSPYWIFQFCCTYVRLTHASNRFQTQDQFVRSQEAGLLKKCSLRHKPCFGRARYLIVYTIIMGADWLQALLALLDFVQRMQSKSHGREQTCTLSTRATTLTSAPCSSQAGKLSKQEFQPCKRYQFHLESSELEFWFFQALPPLPFSAPSWECHFFGKISKAEIFQGFFSNPPTQGMWINGVENLDASFTSSLRRFFWRLFFCVCVFFSGNLLGIMIHPAGWCNLFMIAAHCCMISLCCSRS